MGVTCQQETLISFDTWLRYISFNCMDPVFFDFLPRISFGILPILLTKYNAECVYKKYY